MLFTRFYQSGIKRTCSTCEEDKHAYVSVVGNPEGRRPYKKPKHKEEDLKANLVNTEFINVPSW